MVCSLAQAPARQVHPPWQQRLHRLSPGPPSGRYIEFFNRHVTLGELGCSLSHLSIWEDVVRRGIDLQVCGLTGTVVMFLLVCQVVFEDDARPAPHCLTRFFQEASTACLLPQPEIWPRWQRWRLVAWLGI